eukprot:gene31216-40580_t
MVMASGIPALGRGRPTRSCMVGCHYVRCATDFHCQSIQAIISFCPEIAVPFFELARKNSLDRLELPVHRFLPEHHRIAATRRPHPLREKQPSLSLAAAAARFYVTVAFAVAAIADGRARYCFLSGKHLLRHFWLDAWKYAKALKYSPLSHAYAQEMQTTLSAQAIINQQRNAVVIAKTAAPSTTASTAIAKDKVDTVKKETNITNRVSVSFWTTFENALAENNALSTREITNLINTMRKCEREFVRSVNLDDLEMAATSIQTKN